MNPISSFFDSSSIIIGLRKILIEKLKVSGIEEEKREEISRNIYGGTDIVNVPWSPIYNKMRAVARGQNESVS
jgi:hypothetical protein